MLLLWNSFLGIEEHILAFLLLIDSKIYWAFAKLYSFFIKLARLKLFKEDAFSSVMNNIYVIFGVVALFLIAFILLKEIINPDESKGGKQVGDMIIRFVVISIVIVLMPTIFGFMYDLQDSLLKYGTIQKIMLSDTTDYASTNAYIQDESGKYVFTSDCQASSYEEALRNCKKVSIDATEVVESYDLTSAGYNIGFQVLNGFLAPADGLSDEDVFVNASEYMNLGKGLKISGILCAVGGGIATLVVAGLEIYTSPATGFATLAAVPSTITAFGGTIAAACLGGAAIGAVGSGLTYGITYDKYKWSDAKIEILADGDFNRITSFAEAITSGEMDYTPILSTVAGLILLYMIASFCLDLGVRASKLAFLEILAPICLMISVVPSKKDLMNNWFKKLFTTYMEIFIRIFCVCGVALLISKLDDTIISQLGLLAKAVIVLGLVTFVKQLPKFLSEVTGLDSGNMKLGIREKLAEGGAFTFGAFVGAGATAFANNAVNAGKNFKNNFERGADGKLHKKSGVSNWGLVRSGLGGIGSIVAGTMSAQFRGGKAGWNAKSEKDMSAAASKGAKGAIDARDKRATYKARHGDNVVGSIVGHIGDTIDSIGKWAGINNIDSLLDENKIIDGIQSLRKAIDTEARDLILGDLEKGKAAVSYDTALHNMSNLRNLKNDIDVVRNMTDAEITSRFGAGITKAQAISNTERAYTTYLKDWQDEVTNMGLLGTTAWNSLTKAQQADLAKLRMATNEYRENVARQINQPYVASLSGARDILDPTRDLKVSHALLDDIKAEMKISQTEIQRRIKQVQQKEKDKNGG